MSNPHLPQEITDYIIDLLQDDLETLRQCSLVSRSWLPRSRRRLFARVAFYYPDHVKAWKEYFHDHPNSPGHYIRCLAVFGRTSTTIEVMKDCGLACSFSSVIRLEVGGYHTSLLSLQLSELICSLPLLEDLKISRRLHIRRDRDYDEFRPSASPPLTGTLTTSMSDRTEGLVRVLSDLPNGIHFRQIEGSWCSAEDLQSITTLVNECPDTLERVALEARAASKFPPRSVNLSKATALNEVQFVSFGFDFDWMTLSLQTLTSEHKALRGITIHISHHKGASIDAQSTNLDRTLVRLWESHGIRTKVMCGVCGDGERCTGEWFPEATRKGVIKLV